MVERGWQQIELPFVGAQSEEEHRPIEVDHTDAHRRRIAGYLTMRLPEPADVVFTNNRSTMVSFKRRGGRLIVRLHRLFRHADNEVLESLALYLGNRDKAASKALDQFIVTHKQEIQSARVRKGRPVQAEGRHHDLGVVLDRVNHTYFEGKVDVHIGWGRAPARRRRRRNSRSISRALATYSYDDRTIRVSPILDSADVPDYMIDWIVYHEMLHHVLPVEDSGGKRKYHTERFKTLERAFIRYDEAKLWEKTHLDRLLS